MERVADGVTLASSITFETLFEQSPFSTQILAPDGRTLRVNRAWEELWGVTLEQLGDYNMLQDPQLVETGQMPYIRRGFAGEAVSIPAARYDPDRTLPNLTRHADPVRWVRAFMFPVRDGRGDVTQIVLVHEDVSAEKRAEQEMSAALAEQTGLRDRLAALSDASGTLLASLALADVLPAVGTIAERLIAADAYAVWTGEEGSTQWDVVWQERLSTDFLSRMERWTALGDEDRVLLKQPLFVEDVDSIPFLAPRRAAYAAEGIKSLLIIPLRIGGALRGIVAAYHRQPATFTDADKRVAIAFGHLASTALTTAELYEAQRMHRASAEEAERRAAFLAQAGAVLSSSLDYQDTLRAVARLAVPRVADWCAVDVVIGARLERLAVAHVDPEKVELAMSLHRDYPDSAEAPSVMRQVVQSGVPSHAHRIPDELLVATARDETHLRTLRSLGLTSYMCVPLRAHGETLGALTFVSSDTARLYGEVDVRFAEDLASHAALAVSNARSYKEAREASRLKDEFLATLSHELRTPLNAIFGYARMLKTGILTPERQLRAIETLERNASSLTVLVEDILDVSSIVAGKIRLDLGPVDLPGLLRDAVASLAPAADAKGVAVELLPDVADVPVVGDPDRLRQVVWNLLSNAVKFTPRGGRVVVRLARVESHAEIVVTDTGAGIPPEFLPHVFERFRQADSRFSRDYGGLGLGLAITRHLVEMHGGRVIAESAGAGHGSTFRVLLPVPAVQATRQGASDGRVDVPARRATEAALGNLQGIDVLVVDDEHDALSLVREILESAGARVTIAASAAAGLLALEHTAPDVLISDIGMPGMDGFELIARVRAIDAPALRNIPAAALTAYARSDDRRRAIDAGFQVHLSKPIDPGELVAAVRALHEGFGRQPEPDALR